MHGNCLGGGLQIALGADIRIAAPDTRLSVMEVKWGLVPDMSITRTLPRLVSIDVAKELTFTGRVFDGVEGHRLGVVTRVADDPLTAARELAAEIAGRSPDAVRAAKRLFDASWTGPAGATLALEAAIAAGADRLAEPARRGRRRLHQTAGAVRRSVRRRPIAMHYGTIAAARMDWRAAAVVIRISPRLGPVGKDCQCPPESDRGFAAARTRGSCSGRGRYVDDTRTDNALHVMFIRSYVGHGRIESIDAEAARALPGVQVFTAAEVGLPPSPPPPMVQVHESMHRPAVATDTVRYAGEIVAIVVAESRAASVDAAELVIVEYEPLPAVTDIREAVKDEVLLFPASGSNTCLRIPAQDPDENLFADCDIVISGSNESPRLLALPIEPRSTVAEFEDGKLTI